jgi:hypothetical protein
MEGPAKLLQNPRRNRWFLGLFMLVLVILGVVPHDVHLRPQLWAWHLLRSPDCKRNEPSGRSKNLIAKLPVGFSIAMLEDQGC